MLEMTSASPEVHGISPDIGSHYCIAAGSAAVQLPPGLCRRDLTHQLQDCLIEGHAYCQSW